MPRFQGENFEKNLDLVKQVESLAKEKGCTPAQLALAWVLDQGKDLVPIPGTKRVKYLEDNIGSLNVTLTENDQKKLRNLIDSLPVSGERYPEEGIHSVNI